MKILLFFTLTIFCKSFKAQILKPSEEFKINKVNYTSVTTKKFSTKENQPKLNSLIDKNLYYNCLGFMCKQEYKMQKALKMPLHFRLGSLAHCNYLENKKSW